MPVCSLLRGSMLLAALATVSAFSASLSAQPASPPPPEKYRVTLRYLITSARDLHVMQYDALIKHLENLGFEFLPPYDKRPNTDREDRSKNILSGLISAENAKKIRNNASVASLLLVPQGFDLPADPKQPVRVRIELAGGLQPDRQKQLAEQTRVLLGDQGFREADGYDHHGAGGAPFARLVGSIPAGRLDVLLKDLRGYPAGWLGPRIPLDELPLPLRSVNPIRFTEVLTDLEPSPGISVPPPRPNEIFEKISPELWALATGKATAEEVIPIEIVFAGQGEEDDPGLRQTLRDRAPGIFIEGRLGHIVAARVRADLVKGLAELPEVSLLRLRRPARVDIDPALQIPGDNAKALALSGLADLHKKGFRGQGVRLAVLDTDFRGWEQMVKAKKLPARTRLVDLTTENNSNLLPAPYAGDVDQIGHGTQCAEAAALAAPDADFTLIRLRDAAPHHLAEVLASLRGGRDDSEALARRRDELTIAKDRLDVQRDALLRDRREVLEDFTDDLDIQRDYDFLGPVSGWVFSKRLWIQQRAAHQKKLEADLRELNQRYFRFVDQIKSLKGMQIAANTLTWNDGYPLGGTSPLSRVLDEKADRWPLWFQAAGNTRGQAWSGLFRDKSGEGVMEFATADQPLKKGQWTTELNFLGWKEHGKDESADLPAGARIRITMQWREPHDSDYYLRPGEEDMYRKPLAALRLIVLRQRDREGKKVPADAFNLAAVSVGYPHRLEHLPTSSVYEISVEFTVAKEGRYALRVQRQPTAFWFLVNDAERGRPTFVRLEGANATGIRPAGAATLPALEKNWDLNLRLFVDAVNGSRLKGRPVFDDYVTDGGSTGSPADARNVISVGAADFEGKAQPYSATGPIPYAELSKRPAILAYDALELGKGGAHGTSVAASFAAGVTACLLSSGMTREQLQCLLRERPGQLFKVSPK